MHDIKKVGGEWFKEGKKKGENEERLDRFQVRMLM